MGKSSTGGQRVQHAQRVETAIQLRIGGATVRQIADQIGVSYQHVARMLSRALDETVTRTREEVERLREIEARRMDGVILAQWPKRTDPKHARMVIMASERRARLLGLDAPLRLEDATNRGDDNGPREHLENLSTEELRQWQHLLDKVRQPPATIDADVTEIPASEATLEVEPATPKNGVAKNGVSNGVAHEPGEPGDEEG